MAFVIDHMNDGVSSSVLEQTIIRVSERLRIDHNQATFLLLQYSWREEDIAADATTLLKVAPLLRFSTHRLKLENEFGRCSSCGQYGFCHVLDCLHFGCTACLAGYVVEVMGTGNLAIVCPHQQCNKLINPEAMGDFLNDEQQLGYSRALFNNYLVNTNVPEPHLIEHLKKGLEFVWKNKISLLATGLAGGVAVVAHKINKWRRENPRTCHEIGIVFDQVKNGGCPSDLSFGLEFLGRAKFPGVWKFGSEFHEKAIGDDGVREISAHCSVIFIL